MRRPDRGRRGCSHLLARQEGILFPERVTVPEIIHVRQNLGKELVIRSFFFSNGIDPEYAVIGRVARRIWSKAIDRLYGGNSEHRLRQGRFTFESPTATSAWKCRSPAPSSTRWSARSVGTTPASRSFPT